MQPAHNAKTKAFNVITAVNVEFRYLSFVTADLLNQSPYAVIISLPDYESLEVRGQGGRRKVKFRQKLNTIIDFSQLTVPPSKCNWKGDEVIGEKMVGRTSFTHREILI